MNTNIIGKLIVITFLLLSGILAIAQEYPISKKQVAVYITDNDADAGVNKIVQAKVISTLTNSSQYRVLERNDEFLKKIDDDFSFGTSGKVKEDQIAAIGKNLGAKYVLVIDISELFEDIFITARLVKAETGVIISSAEELVIDPTSQKLMIAAEKVAKGVIGQGGSSSSGNTQNNYSSQSNNYSSTPNVETFTVNGVSFEMVRVDGGSFMMGSNEYDYEKPIHSESVGTFYIGKTEVTQRLWTAVMGSNPSYFKGDNLPVEEVSWDDCMEFIERLSRLTGRTFRLPTEAEWEYAARGGNKSRGYKYSGSNDIDRVAWYGDNSGYKTHPVAQKLDNELGIYDMSGNVWEWVSDSWCDNYSQSRNSSSRVFRGGSWNANATTCRSAIRYGRAPSIRNNNVGFRLAL